MTTTWRDAALCQTYPDLPWILDPEWVTPVEVGCMEVICAVCPVVFECGDFADCEGVTSGFWAGRDRTPASLPVDGVA
jgi:hypothetical protein